VRYAQEGRGVNENEPDRGIYDCKVSQAAAQTGPVLNETFSVLYAEAFDSLVALRRVKSSGALFQSEKLCSAQLCLLQAVGVAEVTSQMHEAICHFPATWPPNVRMHCQVRVRTVELSQMNETLCRNGVQQ